MKIFQCIILIVVIHLTKFPYLNNKRIHILLNKKSH